ncbi:hypothetical protein L208DRAFT_1387297 [Tricholoma matsutake]|nr:hypothetical protein L208DRAFT_1387297 [Tricholoma matsutake 945]
MSRSLPTSSLSCILYHLKIPLAIFSDFLKEAKQTCIETQNGVTNPCQIWLCL